MDILFQDESIIAINKPSGLLTIRDGYNPDLPTIKSELEEIFGHCWIVHRLDKETSGVLLVARSEDSHRLLNTLFQKRQIHKTYHAIIKGIPAVKEFEINFPLKVDGDRRHRTVIDLVYGKPAKSSVIVLESFEGYSLVGISPESGYTHQIRAHLAYTGNPILGDRLYQKTNSSLEDIINRIALHSYQISFIHPITDSPITIQADYPLDFKTTLAAIK